MSNDTALSIILVLVLGMTFALGAIMGYLRRDNEIRVSAWREQLIADQRSAEIDSHWETAIK